MPDVKGRYFHVEALVDNQALHDLLLGLDQLEVYNVQVRAVRPETLSKPARRVAMPMPDQAPAASHKPAPRLRVQPTKRLQEGIRGPRRGSPDYQTIPDRILAFMNEHPPGAKVSTAAIRDRLAPEVTKSSSIYTSLHAMAKHGAIVRVASGWYQRSQP